METGSTTVDDDGPQRLALFASALAGRTVAVASAGSREPAWTDGITVFVDAAETPSRQLESVTVQASLLAGGGLDPDVVRKLGRRSALARRYLAVEGHRALAANEDLLPYSVRSMIDLDLATRTRSPAESLDIATSSKVADPPGSFGVIKPRSLLAAHASVAHADGEEMHSPRSKPSKNLADLDETTPTAPSATMPTPSPARSAVAVRSGNYCSEC